MKNRIFVSGASGVVGYGILKSLESSDYKLYSSSIYPESIANYLSQEFALAPATNEENYSLWLNSFLRSNQIDLAFAGIDIDMHYWSENRALFDNNNCKVVLNNKDIINLCQDKWLFYKRLEQTNCAKYLISTTIESNYKTLIDQLGEVLIVKPRKGFGSKGVNLVKSEKEFRAVSFDPKKLIVQPRVGNDQEEYTIAAFGDGLGSYFNMFSMKRKLATGGYTEEAQVVQNDVFEEAVSIFCDELKPIGPTNFQFRLENGIPKLLEINPRLSSSSSIRAKFGYNEAEMCVDFFLKEKSPRLGNVKKGKAMRYIDERIILE